MAKIYVTRHGETEWNTLGRMQGHLDSPLTKLGEDQARWLGESLKNTPLDYIYSSPSGRAMQTAKAINQSRNLTIRTEENLREIYLGEWEGKVRAEIEAYDAQRYHYFWNAPHQFVATDSESFESVIERSGKMLEEIAKRHPHEVGLVVAHAVVLKSMYAYILKKPIQEFWQGPFMNSTCLNCFEKDEDGWKITLEADISHYPMEVVPKWVQPK